jgi:hypothetical protein
MLIGGMIFTFWYYKKEDVLRRSVSLWIVTLVFTFSLITMVVPKVEKYSQNAMVEFFKSHADEDVYLKNIAFKSYAIMFYGETKPPENKISTMITGY